MGLQEDLRLFAANGFITAGREDRLLALIRQRLSSDLAERLAQTVRHGPFKGLELADAESDFLPKVLGLYEQTFLRWIADRGPWRRLYIVGAVDAYYAAGAVSAGLAEEALIWLGPPEDRKAALRLAQANDVADWVRILGAPEDLLREAKWDDAPGEGDLTLLEAPWGKRLIADENVRKRFARSTIIAAIGDQSFSRPADLAEGVGSCTSSSFDAEAIEDAMRDISGISELDGLSEDVRWLLCSEARERPKGWLALTPKLKNSKVRDRASRAAWLAALRPRFDGEERRWRLFARQSVHSSDYL